MKHATILQTCRGLGLEVRQVPAQDRKSFEATKPGVRVYWSTTYEGNRIGLPRVSVKGRDTHAHSCMEIKSLVEMLS